MRVHCVYDTETDVNPVRRIKLNSVDEWVKKERKKTEKHTERRIKLSKKIEVNNKRENCKIKMLKRVRKLSSFVYCVERCWTNKVHHQTLYDTCVPLVYRWCVIFLLEHMKNVWKGSLPNSIIAHTGSHTHTPSNFYVFFISSFFSLSQYSIWNTSLSRIMSSRK